MHRDSAKVRKTSLFELYMPLGVPKVPYRLPKDNRSQWVDIYNCLSRDRVLFLVRNLDDKRANRLIGLLLYLSFKGKNFDVSLYVNSVGGLEAYGLSLVDAIQYVKVDVNTINVGLAVSIASFVIASGAHKKRFALPHARFMVRQPNGGSRGSAIEVFTDSKEKIRARRVISSLYTKFTGQLRSRIVGDLDRDDFLNAKQACEYGLIDFVGRNEKFFGYSLSNNYFILIKTLKFVVFC